MCKKDLYSSSSFTLDLDQTNSKTYLTMKMLGSTVNTCSLPHTLSFLNSNFPTVLRTQCFNDQNFSFDKEVEATEIGHLFEHIILDELCIKKVARGQKNVVINGLTSWNWNKDPHGVFHITIDVGEEEAELLLSCLRKAIYLIESLLLNTPTIYNSYSPSSQQVYL